MAEEAPPNTTSITAPTNAHVAEGPKRKDAHLIPHDLSTLDVSKLNPLSPEVISRQATINIGMTKSSFNLVVVLLIFYTGTIGHVAHGKSTVVKAISGVQVRLALCVHWHMHL